jgi:hypothetical protein
LQRLIRMEKEECNPRILELLNEKASTKQQVYRKTAEVFEQLKTVLTDVSGELTNSYCKIDESVQIAYQDKGKYEAQISFGGDLVLFNMHTNVFTFEANHHLWKSGYIKEDKRRAYFGMINMYNFLVDSFRFDRKNDVGILLGRIFVNHEGHFFLEGKRQFGFLFNDVANDLLTLAELKKIVETAIIYGLEFDLTAPNFNDVRTLRVSQLQSFSNELKIKTGKKLGFRFHTRMKKES